jgi:hypothetical protein
MGRVISMAYDLNCRDTERNQKGPYKANPSFPHRVRNRFLQRKVCAGISGKRFRKRTPHEDFVTLEAVWEAGQAEMLTLTLSSFFTNEGWVFPA